MGIKLQGGKSPVKSLGIMGPVTGGLAYIGVVIAQAVGVVAADPAFWAETASVVWGLASAVYGRWSATKKIAPIT